MFTLVLLAAGGVSEPVELGFTAPPAAIDLGFVIPDKKRTICPCGRGVPCRCWEGECDCIPCKPAAKVVPLAPFTTPTTGAMPAATNRPRGQVRGSSGASAATGRIFIRVPGAGIRGGTSSGCLSGG